MAFSKFSLLSLNLKFSISLHSSSGTNELVFYIAGYSSSHHQFSVAVFL